MTIQQAELWISSSYFFRCSFLFRWHDLWQALAAERGHEDLAREQARPWPRQRRAYLTVDEAETGPGGRQIQIEDPDGNPIELFEPAR